MTIEARPLEDGITRIDLAGRMDIAGTEQVDLRFSGITSTVSAGAVVDMSGVTFLASIGIRTLITNAKALKLRGALMVLMAPPPLVAEVLRSVGIHDGVTEASDRGGRMFGAERLLETLSRLSALESQPLVEGLLGRVLEFADGQAPADDIAILSVAWQGPPSGEAG